MPRVAVHHPQCQQGRHRARPIRRGEADTQRSTCLDCGAALFRTRAGRQWVFSGLLG